MRLLEGSRSITPATTGGMAEPVLANAPPPSRRRRQGVPLRWRLILLVVAGIVPLLAFSLGNQYLEFRVDTATDRKRMLALAHSMALAVDGALEARVIALQTLATGEALQEGNLDRFRARAGELLHRQFVGADIELVDKDGWEIVNARLPAGAAPARRRDLDSLRRVFATGQPAVSDVYRGTAGNGPVVAIDVPVNDTDGRVLYVLGLHPRLDGFADIIRREHLPAGWLVTVLDRRGTIVARVPNGERFIGDEAPRGLLGPLRTAPDGVASANSLEGAPLHWAFSRSERLGWAVAIGVPRAALTARAKSAALATLLAGSAILALSLLLALCAARGIARPIGTLRRLAAASDRDAWVTPPPTGLPEVDQVAQALYTAEDQRRRSQEALQTSEARFRRVVESVPSAILTVAQDGRIDLVNAQAEQIFGYSRDELIGRPIEMLIPQRQRARHPTLRAAFVAAPQARSMGVGRDLFGVRKSGVEFPVEVGLAPFATEQDAQVLASVIDISARKQAEQELRDARRRSEAASAALRLSEERFRSIFDSVSEGIFISSAAAFSPASTRPAGRCSAICPRS
jgi:PAS domain S-box-containing protein